MLLDYSSCKKQYSNDYQRTQAINDKRIYRIERGIYSDSPYVPELAIIQKKYPTAIFTMESAFYYHDLTTEIPDCYHIATTAKAARLKDTRVKQVYVPDKVFSLGLMEKDQEGTVIRIYSKERMLIELMRYKDKLPYDYYKEIVVNYRDMVYKMDVQRLEEYTDIFPKGQLIWKRLRDEVF